MRRKNSILNTIGSVKRKTDTKELMQDIKDDVKK
jgi:hypothetical protein